MNFKKLYEYRFRGIDLKNKLAVWKPIAEKIYHLMGRPQIVLDPAGGQLEFIGQISATERWVVDLVKYDTAIGTNDIKYVISNIFEAALPEGYFDGIFVSNFLEHLSSPEQIAILLKKLNSAMRQGGRIAIMGPNFKYTATSYFDFADHILPLSHISIEEHLFAAGFEIEKIIPKFVPFSFRGLLPPIPLLTAIYLKLPIFWRLLGKQFLVIGKKK